MQIYSLGVQSQEQTLNLSDSTKINIRFDPFYYRWYGDYYQDGVLVAAGIALDPNTFGCKDILGSSCGIVDIGDPKEEYEPYEQLGNRLAVIQIDEE